MCVIYTYLYLYIYHVCVYVHPSIYICYTNKYELGFILQLFCVCSQHWPFSHKSYSPGTTQCMEKQICTTFMVTSINGVHVYAVASTVAFFKKKTRAIVTGQFKLTSSLLTYLSKTTLTVWFGQCEIDHQVRNKSSIVMKITGEKNPTTLILCQKTSTENSWFVTPPY